jgi:hypothetical protein
VVKGLVLDDGGQRVSGATVTIEGDGWSRRLMSGDAGTYGFGGLCPGPAKLVATLVDGSLTPAQTVSVDGKDTFTINLGDQPAAAPTPAEPPVDSSVTEEEAMATTEPVSTADPAAEAPSSEASMPTTGFPGWILLAVVLIGGLLSLTIGALWSFSARSDSQGKG